MNKENKNYIIAIGIMAFIAILIVICGIKINKNGVSKVADVEPEARPLPTVVVKETVKEVEVKREVTVEIISEELMDMGELNTAEYCFTILEEYSKSKPVFKVFDSTASFMYSYDGSISAGIKCDDIEISKDDNKKEIHIVLPRSKVTHVDIDKESFQAYSEKEQIWNKLTLEDYNDSLKEFETKAKARALEKGVLAKADENARKTIKGLVVSIVDDSEYKVEVVTEGEE